MKVWFPMSNASLMRWLLLVCTMPAGCGLALTMKDWHDQTFQKFRTEGLPRAAFDLQCPVTSLEVIDLAPDAAPHAMQIGVRGCGKQATYVSTDSGWVNNTGSEKAK